MFEGFTDRARRAVLLAQEEARALGHNYVNTEHLLLGLIRDGESAAANILGPLGISHEVIRQQVVEIAGRGHVAFVLRHIPLSPHAKKVLERSREEAQFLGDDYVATEHMLLALTREGGGRAIQILVKLGVDLDSIRQQVKIDRLQREYLGKESPATLHRSGRSPEDEAFERLTNLARVMMSQAQEEARLLDHDRVDAEHVLLRLIRDNEDAAGKSLESLGINLETVRRQVVGIIGRGQLSPDGELHFTPRAIRVLEIAKDEALHLGHGQISTEHILLALMREGEGVAGQVLARLGADIDGIRQQVNQLPGGSENRKSAVAEVGNTGSAGNQRDPAGYGVPANSDNDSLSRRNLAASVRLRIKVREGAGLVRRGESLIKEGKFIEAVSILESAAAIFLEARDARQAAGALYSLGEALQEIGRYRQAVIAFQGAGLNYHESGNALRTALSALHLGEVLQSMEWYGEAAGAFRASVIILRRIPEPRFVSHALLRLGMVLRMLSRTDDAVTVLLDAAASFRAAGEQTGEDAAMRHLKMIQTDH